jgi:membrane-bound ClpP family serine protease
LLLLAALLLPPVAARAQDEFHTEGLFLTVRDPLTSEEYHRLRNLTEGARTRPDRPIRKFVYDFNPGGRASVTRDFGPCADLAAYLLRLSGKASTIAFVHNDVSGHTVLPVLACNELVMAENTDRPPGVDPHPRLGDVLLAERNRPGRGNLEPLESLLAPELEFYRYLAFNRRRSPDVILKMLDRDLEIVCGKIAGTKIDAYVDKKKPERDGKPVIVPAGADIVLPAGVAGFYTAREAELYGLCDKVKETRGEVADAYDLSRSSLQGDPLEGRDPVAVRLVVRERLNSAYRSTLERVIRKAIGEQANTIILELDCNGGDSIEAAGFAKFLRDLRDDSNQYRVMTIAYIPKRAPDVVTFVAFGCTHIVMGKDAEIGDFSALIPENATPDDYAALQKSFEGLLADEPGDQIKLAHAMLNSKQEIYYVVSRLGDPETRLMTREELEQAKTKQPGKWGNEELIKAPGKTLTGEKAIKGGLAQATAESLAELQVHYGIKNVRNLDHDFLYKFAEFLRHPVVGILLIMVGITGLILELKVPGVAFPGILAAVCFILYFWAHSQLAGQITVLAILLFVLGLILIGLEVFVMPGIAILGISGVVLAFCGLGLAAIEKKPETSHEWMQFGQALGSVAISMIGALGMAFLAAWYLPHIPYANRLVLKPPGAAKENVEGLHPDLTEEGAALTSAALLGAIGVAATPLRPAGVARFSDEFVDVVTEGGYVPTGNRVQVIEVEGNRVVVKEV